MRIDNPSISGSLSFIGGTNSISATSVSLTGSLSGTFEGAFSSTATANISGAFNEASAALAQNIETRLLNTTDTLDGDLTVTGTITAQEFHTEFVSASIIYQSGSTQFGDSADDVHTFTGSTYLGRTYFRDQVDISNTFSLNFGSSRIHSTDTSYFLGGNVGIGNDNPDYKLRIDASDDTQLKLNRTGVGAVTLGVASDGGLSIADDGTDRVVIDGSGNIGIGVSPEAGSILHIKRTTADAKITLETSDSYTPFINFSGGSSEYSVGFYRTDSQLRFALGNSITSNVKMVLNGDGNLGIGSESPAATLDVKTSGAAGIARISSDGNGAIYSANGDVQLYTNDAAYSTNIYSANKGGVLVRVKNDGNTGIGNTDPQRKLHVVDTNPQIRVSYDTPTDGRYAEMSWSGLTVYAGDSQNNSANIGMYGGSTSEGKLNFLTGPSTDNQVRMTIGRDGKVGIGYGNPNAILQVSSVAPTYTNNATVFWGSTTNNHSHTGISLTSGGNALQGFVGSNLYWGEDSSTPTQSNTDRSSGYIQFVNTTVAGQRSTIHLGGTVKGSTSVSPIMTVNGTGKVGINDTAPAGKLHIVLNNDSTANISDWSENEVVFARGTGSRTQGIGFGVHTSNATATISSLQPGIAWKALDLRATSFRLLSNGGTDGFSQDTGGNVGFAQNVTVNGSFYLIGSHTRISGDGSGEVGINYSTTNTSTYSLRVYDSTTTVFGVKKDGNIYIRPGATYSQSYSYGDGWTTSFQNVVPTGVLGSNVTYLMQIWTNSFGTPPYYAAASWIFAVSEGTNSGGQSNTIDVATATHVGSNAYWQYNITTASNSKNGIAVKLVNGPTGVSPAVFVRVTEISDF